MSKTITITLTDVEDLALQYIAANPHEWLESFAKHRAEVAIDEIYQKEIVRLMSSGAASISTDKNAVVAEAFANKHVLTAAEANEKTTQDILKHQEQNKA